MSKCPLPVLIRLENIFYEKTLNLNLKQQNYRRVAAKCHEISLEISQRAAKYRRHTNNRSPEILSKNRSKRKVTNLRRIFAKFVEFCLHYFCTIL